MCNLYFSFQIRILRRTDLILFTIYIFSAHFEYARWGKRIYIHKKARIGDFFQCTVVHSVYVSHTIHTDLRMMFMLKDELKLIESSMSSFFNSVCSFLRIITLLLFIQVIQ